MRILEHTEENKNDEQWTEIQRGIHQAHEFQKIPGETYLRLYNIVYDYCSNIERIRTSFTHDSELLLENKGRVTHVQGEKLYRQIQSHIEAYIFNLYQTASTYDEENLILFCTSHWEKYKISSKIIDGFCGYINRYWILTDNTKQFDDIFTLSMIRWKELIFLNFNTQIIRTCLNRIEAERQMEKTHSQCIKDVTDYYITLGYKLQEAQIKKCNLEILEILDIYEKYFEKPFLQETVEFYKRKVSTFNFENPIIGYLEWVDQSFAGEENRVKLYLHPSTSKSIVEIFDDVVIRDKLDSLINGAEFLLSNCKSQEWALIYKYLSRVPESINHLQHIVGKLIYESGMQTIQNISEIAIEDSTVYINTILEFYNKYLTLIKYSFGADTGNFILVLNNAFNRVLNRNAVTIAARDSIKSAELLARFSNTTFQRKIPSVDIDKQTMEEHVRDIMLVFRNIDHKDEFLNFYWRLFAERLIYKQSISDEYENMMIDALQKECGLAYTYRLKRMIPDSNSHENLMKQYEKHCEEHNSTGSINFSIIILAVNLWPLQVLSDFDLPYELAPAIDNFIQFYYQQHNNRKLTWLYQYSTGEMHAHFNKSTYILQASAYEIAILLLFNDVSELTVQQIYEKTHIRTNILIDVLCTLIDKNLLKCLQIDKKGLEEMNLQMQHVIQLNENFTSEDIHVNLNKPLKTARKHVILQAQKSVDNDRKYAIRAAVVRIMKNRKFLSQNSLIQETIDKLEKICFCDCYGVEHAIEYLIDKEYLKQQKDGEKLLEYQP